MSGNTFTCRDRYFNYGSYLRSRGYDKEICNLIVAIEQGQIPIGPIYPGNCSKRITTVIKGNVDIVPCEATDNNPTPISGQLTVTGGYIGVGGIDVSAGTNIPSQVALQAQGFGIQSLNGISSNGGPIYQQTDCNHSNWFGAKYHVFVGGVGGTGDCSTNVIIRGNLFVDGTTVELNGFIGETLTLITLPGNTALGTLNTFKSQVSNGNMLDMYATDLSSVALLSGDNQWKNFLSFAVDGNSYHTQTDVSGIDVSAGMSNVMGHMRGFRGLTITNPPLGGPVDIQWNPDISGTSRAIDAYGSIRVQPGNTDGTGSNALGNIDISGGQFRIFQNDISNVVLFSNGDASFNGRVSCYDLSVTNIATIGTSTTYIDTSNVNTSYVTVDNSLNTHFIYTPSSNDMYINAGSGGTFSDIYMNANNIFMDSDLSVNDVSSSNINNTGLIVTHDISVNNHASIYDLSVGNITIIDTGLIETYDLSVNHHAFIYDLSVVNFMTVGTSTTTIDTNHIQANSGEFIDISVNNHASIYDLSVGNITIIDTGLIETYDLSVNHHAFIYDLSVVNFMTVGTSTTTIDTNHIQANSGEFMDISVNNNIQAENFIGCNWDISAGRVVSAPLGDFGNIQQTEPTGSIKTYQISSWPSPSNIIDISTAGGTVRFTETNNVIMSNSDLSAGDISANNIQANSGEFIDISVNHHASIFDLSVGNITIIDTGLIETYDLSVNHHAFIYDLSVVNFMTVGMATTTIDTNSIQANSAHIPDLSVNTLQSTLFNNLTIKAGAAGAKKITFSASDIIMSSSDLSANDISASIIQAKNFILDVGNGNLKDLSNNVTDLSSNVTDLRSTVTDLSSNVTELRSTVTDLSSNVTDLRSTVTDLSSNVTDLRSTVTDLSSNVTDLRSTVTDLSSNVTDLRSTVTDLSSNVTDLRITVTDLSSNVTELRSTVTDLSSNVTELRSTVTDLSSNVTELRSTVTDLSSNVTELRITVTDLSSNVTDLSSNVTELRSTVTDLSSNVTNLDTSIAIVEKVASLRYRVASDTTPYSLATYEHIQSFDTSDISNNMSMNIGLIPANKGKITIPYTGIYSYNLQLGCTTHASTTHIYLAINDNSANSPTAPLNTAIASAGSTGGVNRAYVNGVDFTAGSTAGNTIGLSGISKFTSENVVQPYIKVTGGLSPSVTLDNANESIFSMALLYATD